MRQFDRIICDPQVMAGQACVRGMRIPVSLVLNLVAHGMKARDIIEEHPDLTLEDVQQCLDYGEWLARDQPDRRTP